MSRVAVLPATLEHAETIAANARPADVAELWAFSRTTPLQALRYGVAASTSAWAGFIDGEPVCMFGVTPGSIVGGIGIPWMVGTDAVERHQMAFLRHCRPHVEGIRSLYDVLVNWVDERNRVAHRWLRWCGFTLHDPEPHGPDGMLFRRFDWRRNDV